VARGARIGYTFSSFSGAYLPPVYGYGVVKKRENRAGHSAGVHTVRVPVYDLVNAGPNFRFVAEGKLVSNCRVLPWLANDEKANIVLDIFRQGRDLYIENAVRMFGLRSDSECTKDLRQAAKISTLSCGFGGGKNALGSMAKAYGMKLSEEQASDIVGLWRSANPWASGLWYGLKDAAHDAVRYPREMFTHGRISFLYDGADWLWMRLPSGRCLAYFSPRFEEVMMPWGDLGLEVTCLWGSNKPKVGQPWPRRTLNHLILSENATQATAADLMRETMVRADKAGLPVLFSVHDELVVQGDHVARLQDLMTYCPEWAAGLPLAAETKHSLRYGK
jgi:DNA polymerase